MRTVPGCAIIGPGPEQRDRCVRLMTRTDNLSTMTETDVPGEPARWERADFEGRYLERRVDVGDVTIAFTEWNPTAPTAVLMIHGFNVQGHTWDPIANELAEDYRVIVPDLRGHGRSSWAVDGYFVSNFVADLIGLLDDLGIRQCHVVGHSLGARIALGLAGSHPERVRRLVLSDNGPETPSDAAQRAKATGDRRAARRGFRDEDEAADLYAEQHPEWKPVFRELHVRHQIRRNWAGKLIERSDPDLFWVTRSAGRSDDTRLWALAANVTAPTLLIWGASSPYMNDELVERMRAKIPDFRNVMLPCGHYVPRELPSEFTSLTREFLEAESASGRPTR